MSTDVAESPRFRFKIGQETLDRIKKDGESFLNRLTPKSVGDVIERYKRGVAQLVVSLTSGTGTGDVVSEYELIFETVPGGLDDEGGYATRKMPKQPDSEQLVFVRNGYLVEFPKGVIPSSVRLIRAKERVKTLGDILAPCLHTVLKRDGVVAERESGVSRPDLSSGDSDSIHSIVEARSQVVNSVRSEVSEMRRDGLSELELVYFLVRVIRIRLDNYAAFIGLPEDLSLPLKIRDAFLRKRDLAA
jgi:hypothetical protein